MTPINPNINNTSPARVGIFSPNLSSLGKVSTASDVLLKTYRNTGNTLYWEAPVRQIAFDAAIEDWNFDEHDIDTLVLSLGNWVSPAADMSDLSLALENSRISNVVMLGAGVQAQNQIDIGSLTHGTKRFIEVVAERTKSIGVRGEFTASVFEKIGVKNIDVIGCPSVYLINNKDIEADDSHNIALSINTTWHGYYRDAIAELLKFGQMHEASLIEQSDLSVMKLAQGCKPDKDAGFISRYYSTDYAASWANLEYLQKYAQFYVDPQSWRDALRECDLVVGSRFHGIVAGLQAGVRSLLLTIDVRTRELANFFNLPSLAFDKFDATQDIRSYYDIAGPELFHKTLRSRIIDYQSFLVRNGLTLNDEFRAVVGHGSDYADAPLEISQTGDREIARYLSDIANADMNPRTACIELLRRLEKSRDDETGSSIEKSEFVISYKERIGVEPIESRQSWRQRQGVSNLYQHQVVAKAYDDTCAADEWQRYMYLNARRVFDANVLSGIVDFGCGSGYKLLANFRDVPFIGIEVGDTLQFLLKEYPNSQWIDGMVIHPSMFGEGLVICSDVLEHLYEPDYLLAAMAASPAQVFVLSTPALELLSERGTSPRLGPPANQCHVFEWTTSEFFDFVSKHLNVRVHMITSLSQATQMCIATKKDSEFDLNLPELLGI